MDAAQPVPAEQVGDGKVNIDLFKKKQKTN